MALPEMYFSVDIEANGPIPGEYSMSSLGCAVVGDAGKTFYAELKPISEKEVPEAAKVSGLSMAHLKAKGEDPAAAMKKFAEWVRAAAGATHHPVFVAFNATFDWMFVHWYLMKFAGGNPFGISGLDIKAYYMGMTDGTWAATKKEHVTQKFPTTQKHTHNALDDAKEQGELFAKMREFQKLKRV